MSYTVISFFTDLRDLGYPYHPGDKFPRDGMTVSNDRISELAGSNNKQGKPLIKLDDDFSEDNVSEKLTKTDVNRMSKSELVERVKALGLEDAEKKTGAELKKYLLNELGL